jgi:toxin FitB
VKGWVLDTNVISETRRPRPSLAVLDWMSSVETEKIYTTRVNIAEIRYGIANLGSPEHAQLLQRWLEETVRPGFAGRILEADEDAFIAWRSIARHNAKLRLAAPPVDLLVAAIAVRHGLAVATRDAAPFVAAGVAVFNPFTAERFNGT